jgi:hypothetical protein
MALGGAVLADQLARPPLRDAQHTLQVLDGAAPAGRAHQVPRPSSFNAWIWSSLSATIRFNLGVLALQFLEPADVVGLQAAVLGPPAVVGGLADLQLLGHLGDLVALGQQPLSLAELADDLLGVWRRRFMESSCHQGDRTLIPAGPPSGGQVTVAFASAS